MPQILVLADDLSGAADCGIGFANFGLTTVVRLADPCAGDDQACGDGHGRGAGEPDRAGNGSAAPAVDVLALDADSRGLPPAAAAAANRWIVERHLVGGTLLYKKIDSTLRGNVAAELAAIIPLAGLAIVAPAFPDTGRVTRDGRVFVNDVPLEATEIWQREGLAGIADITAILRRAGLRAARAELALVRSDAAAFAQALSRMAADGVSAIVCDAEINQDLAAIAAVSVRLTCPRFWVGSAGLARYLPAAAGIVPARRGQPVATQRTPVLFAVGSLSAVSRGQARRLSETQGVTTLTLTPEVLRQGPADPGWQAVAAALEQALASDADVLLVIDDGAVRDLAEGVALAQALGRLVQASATRFGSLVATGGDTARAVLGALGVAGLRLVDEIEPGVALSTAERGRALTVITKAGAFGTPETLVHCRAVLRGSAAAQPGS